MYKIVFVLIIIALYAHLYLHFLVNPNNECSLLEDISKEDITNAVYVKHPFYFDATVLRKELDLTVKTKDVSKYIKVYDLSYDEVPLLEPYVRFYSTRKGVHFIKKKKWLDTNNSCRTFYRIHKGIFDVYCIHPKYKEFVSSKTEIKDVSKFIKLTLHQDSILFLPRSWYILFEALEKDSKIEQIQYFTPLNKVANAISTIIK